jgi:hypothetical protein
MSDTKTSADLMPCPFCGGPVELERTTSRFEEEHGGHRQYWGVVCRNTINRGGTCAIEQRPSASEEAAIERWNRRAAMQTAEPVALTDADINEIAGKFVNRYILAGHKHKEFDALGFGKELQAQILELNGAENGKH